MISDSMPKNSEHISWFSVYVTTQIILSGFSVIMETVVLHMHYKDVVLSRAIDLVDDVAFSNGALCELFKNLDCVIKRDNQNKKQENRMSRAERFDKGMMIFSICTNIVSFCTCAIFVLR